MVQSDWPVEATNRRNFVKRVLAVSQRPGVRDQSRSRAIRLRLLWQSICRVRSRAAWCGCQTTSRVNPRGRRQLVSNFSNLIRSRLWQRITKRRSSRSHPVHKFSTFENLPEIKKTGCRISIKFQIYYWLPKDWTAPLRHQEIQHLILRGQMREKSRYSNSFSWKQRLN
jgi:hypothetical protein